MSFLDQSAIPAKARMGCFAYGIVGSIIVITLLVGAAMGDCAPNIDGSGCRNDGWIKFAMFPGSLIVFVVGGVILARHVTKDRS